jgi:hypothetical protein
MLRRANPPTYRSPRSAPAGPLGLTGAQLEHVMTACGPLEPEKRSQFLERVAAKLTLLGAFTDGDLDRAIAAALSGLIHAREPAA